MVHIVKSIDIISPADGKHYTSLREYEKALDQKGQYIMEDKTYRELKERLLDEAHSAPKPRNNHNHVHIDFANDRIETSHRDIQVDE